MYDQERPQVIKVVGRQSLTRDEVAEKLGWDPVYTSRVLAACVTTGELTKPGAQRGRSTVYARS